MKTGIKICGLTNLSDALDAVNAGADAIGFVFSDSPRRMAPRDVKDIIDRLPPFVHTVGVFVNEPIERLLETVALSGVSIVQLQGHESKEYCRQTGKPVIKGFRVGPDFRPEIVNEYDVMAYLFDACVVGKDGGTGVSFDWEQLKGVRFRRPVIISGGLHAGNVSRMMNCLNPSGVDVSSGVGATPTHKDRNKLCAFIGAVRNFHSSAEEDILRDSFDGQPLVDINGKRFLINSLTEQVPATSAPLLRIAAQRVCDAMVRQPGLKLVGEEDKGGVLLAAVSLLSGLPFGIARWYPSGLEGQVKVDFGCEYTSGALYLNGVNPGDRIVIVDDMISTGGTLISLIEAVKRAGACIEQIICVAEKADYDGVSRVRETTGIDVNTLLRISISGDVSRVLTVNY